MHIKSLLKSFLKGLLMGALFFLLVPVILFGLIGYGLQVNEWYSLPFLAVLVIIVSVFSEDHFRELALGMAAALLVLWATTISHPLMGIASCAVIALASLPIYLWNTSWKKDVSLDLKDCENL